MTQNIREIASDANTISHHIWLYFVEEIAERPVDYTDPRIANLLLAKAGFDIVQVLAAAVDKQPSAPVVENLVENLAEVLNNQLTD